MEKTDYDVIHKDVSESIDALERAMAVRKKQAYHQTQASFAQLKTLIFWNSFQEAENAINAFSEQEPDEGLAVGALEVYGYEFQFQGVMECWKS